MARPRKPKFHPPSNCTDETYIEYAAKIRAAELDKQEADVVAKAAMGVYRNVIKASKNAGVDTDALLWGIKAGRRDEGDVKKEIAGRARVAALLQLPIGGSFGLFEEPPEVDPTLAARVKGLNAKQKGTEAGRKLADREENPYEAGTEEYAAWDEGWHDGNQAHFKDKPKPVRATKAATGGDGPEMGGAAEGEETWSCPLGLTHTGPKIDDNTLAEIRNVGFEAYSLGKMIDDVPSDLTLPGQKHWRHGFEHAQKMAQSLTGTKAA
jgi:hypothetical protein